MNNTINEEKIGEVDFLGDGSKFVRVPMKMFAYETKYYATDDEIAVFYEIVYHAWARDTSISIVNVDMFYHRLQWDAKTQSRGKNRIIKAIEGLEEKGYISVKHGDEKIKATTYLTIRTQKNRDEIFNEKVESGSSKYSGWERMTEVTADKAKRDIKKVGQRMKVLTYISWRANIDYAICYEEWANVLGVSASTAKRIIKSLEDEGIIYKQSGRYYTDCNGQVRQEINKYEHAENVEVEQVEEYKPTIVQRQRKFLSVAELLMETTDKRMMERPGLFEHGSTLGVDDMYIYKTTTCSLVKEWGNKRFKAISKNTKGEVMVRAWEEQVDSMLSDGIDVSNEYEEDAEDLLDLFNKEDENHYQEVQQRKKETEKKEMSQDTLDWLKSMQEEEEEEYYEEYDYQYLGVVVK